MPRMISLPFRHRCVIGLIVCLCGAVIRAEESELDVFKHNGLPPAEAARAMETPQGFQVTLVAGEPDVQQPIAMAIDDRGRLWVAEAYSYPVRVAPNEARDRILIFEDDDGDGTFDRRKIFAERLNLVSGLALGFGGVWVGAAPELLFIPDADGDDHPDGAPQVLLDGWGYQDTHETLNAFIWGPDGWLYGCHGVFTHSRVGRPGTPDAERTPINAGIWRYHPTRHEFEVFAHGTSNPWGVDFNDRGQCFLTACVIPHLFHVVQNGRYFRQAGEHFNPYTYDDIKTIARHRHWIGDRPHAGNNHSDSSGGGHAHSGAMIYLGGKWPERYRDQIFMNNIHGARINQDVLFPQGSGYVGDRAPDFLLANDSFSQLLYFTYGPDGDVYMIDWYDRQQCHHRDTATHDRSNGRIFKVSYGPPQATKVDLQKLSSAELVELQLHANDWYVRHARRILQERAAASATPPAVRDRLHELASTHADVARRLRALWALHALGVIDDALLVKRLSGDPDPYVRGWCVQLACERKTPSADMHRAMLAAAEHDPSPIVRLYLAAALPRLSPTAATVILTRLVAHGEDAADHNLPLLYWYAAEPTVARDPSSAMRLRAASHIDVVSDYLVRRTAQLGSAEALEALTLRMPENSAERRRFLAEWTVGLAGRRRVPMPPSWPSLYERLAADADGAVRSVSDRLALTFGDARAEERLRRTAIDAAETAELRTAAIEALTQARVEGLAPLLQSLVRDRAVRRATLHGLAAYDDAQTPTVVFAAYEKFNATERRDALDLLSSRVGYAGLLLDAVESKRIAAAEFSADMVRQLRNLKHPEIQRRIENIWGTVNDTPEERRRQIAQYKRMLSSPPRRPPDPAVGRAIFDKTCAQCHTLFGVGGKVGPELTGSNRANLDYLLTNLLDPSALIGKDYVAHVVETTDGRVLTGLVRSETPAALTLATATETIVLPKSEIESRAPSRKSMMPEDLLKPLSEAEVRALAAYLSAPSQVPPPTQP